MKKDCNSSGKYIPDIWLQVGKILIFMKLSFVILLLSLFTARASVYSQSTKLNLNLNEVSIKQILSKIEDQSEFRFAYSSEYLDLDKKVTVQFEDESIESILKYLFRDSNIEYTIKDRVIILHENSTGKIGATKQIEVTGKVTDTSGQPLPGVTVIIKGTTKGTITDFDGIYLLSDVPADATFIFSFVGMKKQEVLVAGRTVIDAVLEDESIGLDEVVAVGYGTQMKKELTGSVVRVQSETLERMNSANFIDALQGQVAGVNIQASSGEPGAATNIQIRGVGSFSSGALEPLYVVDGIPYESNPNISQYEIESIDILKDAASASIYGTRASNGVILITTKKGTKGGMKINFNADYGIQNITSGIPLVNSIEKLYLYETTYQVQNGEVVTSGDRILWRLSNSKNMLLYDTNWQEILTNNNAPISNYSLRLYGGKDDLKYNFTTTYFDQEGILTETSGYRRLTTRGNMNFKSGKLFGDINMSGNYSIKNRTPGDLSHAAIRLNSNTRPVSSGEILTIEDDSDNDANNNLSYFARTLLREDDEKVNSFNVNARIGLNINKRLTFELKGAGNVYNMHRKTYNPSVLVYSQEGELLGSSKPLADLKDYQSMRYKWMVEALAKYQINIEKHNLNFLAVSSAEINNSSWFYGYGEDFLSNDVRVLSGAASSYIVGGEDTNNALVGVLGRVQYNYAWKYLLSASVRRDGSSKFGLENKYATFPSLSAGWNISQEKFFKNSNFLKNVDNLKIRYSYGTAGNQSIPSYSYSTAIESKVDYVFNGSTNEHIALGATQRGYSNANVKWETSISQNLGIDLTMYGGKFSFTGDVYHTEKLDMLFPVTLPGSAGTGNSWGNQSVIMNIGNMINKGVELAGTYRKQGIFSFDATLTFSKNINKVTKTNLSTSTIYGGSPQPFGNADLTTVIREGYTAGTFFLIPTDGLIKTQDELDEYHKLDPSAALGDLKYVDTNNDGVIDDNDRIDHGSGNPDFEGGLVFNARYRNFDLNIQFYGSYGNKIFNGSKAYAYVKKNHKDLIYAYTAENTNTIIPRSAYGQSHPNVRTRSDYFLEDGSYLRLRNIQLGYSFSEAFLKKLKLSKFRVYLSAQNPITWTKYTGYDPEVGNDGLLSKGVDAGTYPVTAVYRIGLNIGL